VLLRRMSHDYTHASLTAIPSGALKAMRYHVQELLSSMFDGTTLPYRF